jgi:hypothetical protein
MIKLKSLLFESKILIPRRTPEEREKTHIAEQYRIIQRYIRDGCQGGLYLQGSPIKVLPNNLTHVGGNLDLESSKIENLNNLEKVDGDLILNRCINLKTLGKLKEVIGDIRFLYTNTIETLENLETVGGNLVLSSYYDPNLNFKLKSLGKLKFVNGLLDLDNTEIKSLDNLEYVGDRLFLRNTKNLNSFGNLKKVQYNIYLKNSNILNIMTEKEIRRQVQIKGEIFTW